ncbi:PP2C family protein-serine/threonine phosphatase [Streptomyces sp. AK02-01A]|uniref:PP2C family protein-serine/threonine phosphatase n=1 Tax=Streptomyces sp. AK02-01A TaxID=3028648 RepID=UPI0029BC799B|nr:PP2C family protein-serine/threonine phosphatase [Streptomyces sp. AK02-01A]MDX3855238.1 PP2C family protein-serine/threonine phosphatase [Streptomyces sp. AK02-01A]
MGRAGYLRKPELRGAHAELNAALHRLHLHAGLPSLADIAAQLRHSGISRSTVHDAFSSQRMPKWKVVDALVEILASQTPGGRPEEDQAVLHAVWLRAAQGNEARHSSSGAGSADEATEDWRRLLPDHLPRLDGVELAYHYLPAVRDHAGGDWYDAFRLGENKIALVVGDVMGPSTLSVAIMSQMRSTLQLLVELGLPPHEVLRRLDAQSARLGSEGLATCVCVVYDSKARTLALSAAGHVPPVLLNDRGEAFPLDVPTGTPIGLGGEGMETTELDIPLGSTIFLYTDGLVETRLREISTGITYMCDTLVAAHRRARFQPPPLESLCDDILATLAGQYLFDDAVLLAARFTPGAPPVVYPV